MKTKLPARMILAAVLSLTGAGSVIGQQTLSTTVRTYRGSIGDNHIQMSLSITGNKVTGTYSYDSVGQELKLTGTLDAQGRLSLAEFVKGKQTGKFSCKNLGDEIDPECTWSRVDGTRESLVTLAEQFIGSSSSLQVRPKTISNRKSGVTVSYPQISGSTPLSPAAQNFNRRMLALTHSAINEFAPIDDKGVFDTYYNILMGSNELISIEMVEYSDGGGAHPNSRFWSLTYDLAANKELKLDDLFKPDSDYKTAIANYIVTDIQRRAKALEEADAKLQGRKPDPRDEPIVSAEELSELSGWALTPKGLVVYIDFPHVMAVFDRTFIPFSVVNEYLKPNGPASRIPKT